MTDLTESNPPVRDAVIPATGNGMKSHATYDAFLEVSHGWGNSPAPEVHLLMRSNDGDFAQGWFRIDALMEAVHGKSSVDQVVDRLSSFSSAAVEQIITAGQKIQDERFADGVFE